MVDDSGPAQATAPEAPFGSIPELPRPEREQAISASLGFVATLGFIPYIVAVVSATNYDASTGQIFVLTIQLIVHLIASFLLILAGQRAVDALERVRAGLRARASGASSMIELARWLSEAQADCRLHALESASTKANLSIMLGMVFTVLSLVQSGPEFANFGKKLATSTDISSISTLMAIAPKAFACTLFGLSSAILLSLGMAMGARRGLAPYIDTEDDETVTRVWQERATIDDRQVGAIAKALGEIETFRKLSTAAEALGLYAAKIASLQEGLAKIPDIIVKLDTSTTSIGAAVKDMSTTATKIANIDTSVRTFSDRIADLGTSLPPKLSEGLVKGVQDSAVVLGQQIVGALLNQTGAHSEELKKNRETLHQTIQSFASATTEVLGRWQQALDDINATKSHTQALEEKWKQLAEALSTLNSAVDEFNKQAHTSNIVVKLTEGLLSEAYTERDRALRESMETREAATRALEQVRTVIRGGAR